MAHFQSNRKEIDGNIRRSFARAMEDTVGDADDRAPVDEGALHASITWQWRNESIEHLQARFGSALRYAAMRELGGTIRPVRKKRLVWRSHDGRWHSASIVIQQPGGKRGSPKYGQSYIRPAGEGFGDRMDDQLQRAG